MEKLGKLKDGTEVLIRSANPADLDGVLAFFETVPEEDRRFLRFDVTRRDVMERRLRTTEEGRLQRLVAETGGKIVADGLLEFEPEGWKQHVAEIRVFVSPAYQRKGLGMLMTRELYWLATAGKVEEIIAKMMRPQHAARRIFRKLGFHEEILMPDYVKDRHGSRQDLILMRCDLESLWQELEDYFADGDWQRTR